MDRGLTDTTSDDHSADPQTRPKLLEEDLGGDLKQNVEHEERGETCRGGFSLVVMVQDKSWGVLTGVVDAVGHGDRIEQTSDPGIPDIASIKEGQEVGDGERRQDSHLFAKRILEASQIDP